TAADRPDAPRRLEGRLAGDDGAGASGEHGQGLERLVAGAPEAKVGEGRNGESISGGQGMLVAANMHDALTPDGHDDLLPRHVVFEADRVGLDGGAPHGVLGRTTTGSGNA